MVIPAAVAGREGRREGGLFLLLLMRGFDATAATFSGPMHPIHFTGPMHPICPIHPIGPLQPLHPMHPMHPIGPTPIMFTIQCGCKS